MPLLLGAGLYPQGLYFSAFTANSEQDLVVVLSSLVNTSQADTQQFGSCPIRDNLLVLVYWYLGLK